MPDVYPLLLFPAASIADRNPMGGGGGSFTRPTPERQGVRLSPKFAALQAAFEAERLRLQQVAPAENPEFVVVLETIGTIKNFSKAVAKVPGLEWLLESTLDQIEPDEDFFVEGKAEKSLSGRLFLLGSNQQALTEILSLWERYKADPNTRFKQGLAPWKHVFAQLKDVRRWSVQDRVGADIRAYWQDAVAPPHQRVRFEIEAWCYRSADKNDDARDRIEALIRAEGGQVLGRALIPDISYHGFLVDMPAASIRAVLDGAETELTLSERVMFFRPRAQSVAVPSPPEQGAPAPDVIGPVGGEPVVALLDGLPLQNHAVLFNRIVVDDPDNWEPEYEAKDRVHGTAMASLIVHGELDTPTAPLTRPIYVRPILRPDAAEVGARRAERTPADILLLDLIHRAVKRICEGEGDGPAAAPSVRVINLSVGDEHRPFERELSPWARLIDWLSFRYRVLFVVSAGNCDGTLRLQAPKETIGNLDAYTRSTLALSALVASDIDRRLIAPAESINALTVGACHTDDSQPPNVPGRYDLLSRGEPSPYSRVGHGFRRSVKPDILVPGGRVLYREQLIGPQDITVVEPVGVPRAPGHRVAAPPLPGILNATEYSRGTSNAAALASRAAARALDVIDAIRATQPEALPRQYDAVLIKALLAHGAGWNALSKRLLSLRPDIKDWRKRREFVARWIGYGVADTERALVCADQRATLIGVGEVGADEALVFDAPLPPSLSAQAVPKQMVVTLAWFSPTSPSNQAYRSAKLWVSPPHEEIRVQRVECVHDHAQRGTLQHDVLQGDEAVAFVDGKTLQFKVNCAADASEFGGKIPFALCVSLEVPVETNLPIYREIRERVAPTIQVQAAV
jgi:hypothetical protein